MRKQLPGRSQQEGEDVPHQHVEALCGESRIEETATPGRRDIPGSLKGEPRWAADVSWASRGTILRLLQLGK